jgi:two-component system cell cycle sensor histidine kinase/response regulator CckA
MKQSIRILHLEDESNDVELARAALAAEGIACEIVVAGNGEEFADALERGDFDLIIADYNLPGFDGLAALAMTREKYPDCPFIFLSGTMGEDIAIESLKNGATDYVLKHRLSRLAPAVRRSLQEQDQRVARHQAERTLRESEARYRALFENSIDAILLTIPDGRILTANPEACRIFGRTEEEIRHIGRSGVVDAHDPRLQAALEERSRTGRFKGELTFLRKDGSTFPGEISAALFKDKDDNTISSMIIRDITEKRALESQLRHVQKMDAIGTLAGGIAHDFNNLLTAIIGFGTILEMKMSPDDPLRKNVSHILTAADRAAGLTRSLLTFSRDQPLDPKLVNLNDIVSTSEKLFRRLLREDIECRVLLSEEELTIHADPGQIDQILLNLATNARDAMPDGGELTISTMLMDMDQRFISAHGYGTVGHYAVLSVTDTGTGMDEAVRLRIFEPFYTTKDVGKGTGLGLSIIYGIVKQHHGFITCYSEPGSGTTFNTYLPLHEGTAEQKTRQVTDQPAGGAETILLAEDDEMVRNLTRTVLEGAGYRVIEAVNGRNAVQQFMDNRNEITLLVLDLIMPRMNGRDAYHEIREVNPHIRAIFTSGYSADVANLQELAGDRSDFIAKPARPVDLLKKVREVLDRS